MNRLHLFRPSRAAVASRPTRRLQVDSLEDRSVPAVFTVTDTGDNGGVNPAPFAGTGTLRQAIIDANATPGTDSITFSLPDSLKSAGGWWTIQPAASLPIVSDPATIDGWTQTGAGPGLAPRVVIDGSQAGVARGIYIVANNSTVRGLTVDNFSSADSTPGTGVAVRLDGTNDAVLGCYLGVDPTGTTAAPNVYGVGDDGVGTLIGGGDPGDGNVISGNRNVNVFGGTGATIRGNLIGTSAAGTAAIPGSASVGIMNVSGTVADNVISGNAGGGIMVGGVSHLRIFGNLIGTDVTGMHPLGNLGPGTAGIWVFGGVTDCVIGGTDATSRNVISANGHFGGIRIESPGVVVQGNYIGTDATGTTLLGNGGAGISTGGNGCLIGGPQSGAGNLIAGNGADGTYPGIYLASSNNLVQGNVIRNNYRAGVCIGFGGQGWDNTIRQNAIYGNFPNPFDNGAGSGLGIDILADNSDTGGVTLNDSLGHDGPNHFQNFPVLTAAHCGGASGTLNSVPNTNFRIEFFANHEADPSGYGEGERYVGFLNVTTDAPIDALQDGEQYLTATATNLTTGDTSEFSNAVTIEPPPTAGISGPTVAVRGQPLTFTLTATGDAGPFTFNIDWDGNGTVDETVTGPSGTTVQHTYTDAGSDTVKVTATDPDGCTSQVATTTVDVGIARLENDPLASGQQALYVGGTTGNDTIVLSPATGGQVQVQINGSAVGTFAPTSRLVVYAQAGNDDVQVAGGITLPAWLYGGAGDDRLKGGSGNNVLIGGDGNDLLVGGSNRDILIGGAGADRLVGNAEDDVLIAGYSVYDANETALAAILSAWTDPSRSYQDRVSALTTTGVGTNQGIKLTANTVSDDGAQDVLTGSSGQDWFLANVSGGGVLDKLTDLSAAEFATDLSFILGP